MSISSGFMLYWIIPTSISTLKLIILNLLVMSPIAGAIITIILKGSGEEEKYIGTLKKIENKEN